jgi:hypothetical protein
MGFKRSKSEQSPLCRLCRRELASADLIFGIEEAPRSAQELPTREQLQAGTYTAPLDLYQCSFCCHYQVSSQPVDYWREVITAAGLSEKMRVFRDQQLSTWIRKYSLQEKIVLEIGSGEGYLLDILKNAGASPIGMEFNATSVNIGRGKGRVIIHRHLYDDVPELANIEISGFICINFLEHAPDPVLFLRRLREIVQPGSYGIVEVPNFSKDLRLNRAHNIVRDHLSYFTQDSLVRLLAVSGYSLLSIHDCWDGEDLVAEVQVNSRPARPEWKSEVTLIRKLRQVLSRSQERFAIWGASHQCLTLLAIIKPLNVLAIADSAEFKQGRTDPACGIPILSPEEMLQKEPDTVIIIAGGYSTEIEDLLKTRYRFQGHVVILD